MRRVLPLLKGVDPAERLCVRRQRNLRHFFPEHHEVRRSHRRKLERHRRAAN